MNVIFTALFEVFTYLYYQRFKPCFELKKGGKVFIMSYTQEMRSLNITFCKPSLNDLMFILIFNIFSW